MKPPICRIAALALLCLVQSAHAVDTTPPTLTIPQTWIEKSGSFFYFKMNLDPQDETGVDKIEFRSALNSTAALPANAPWSWYPWTRGQPFEIGFNCTSVVFEIRSKDAAGNVSPLQRRTFKAPFPITTAPNLDPMFGPSPLRFTSPELLSDFRGLFTADFDGLGRDDLLEIDNSTGLVNVRRQLADGTFTSNGFSVPAGTIQDSAIGDFDHDGLMDIILVLDHDVKVYHNDGLDVNGALQFTGSVPLGRSSSGIVTVEHIAVANLTTDNKPEVVIVGTGDDGAGGTVMKMEMIDNNGAGVLHGHITSRGPDLASAGRIAIGDLTGDGIADVAMVDLFELKLLVFKGLGNGVFGGVDDAVVANRPLSIDSYFYCDAIAIGDLEGTGRNGVIMTQHYFGTIPLAPYNDDQKHNAQFWQYFAPDYSGGLVPYTPQYLSIGPAAAVSAPPRSDVIIRDYTGDRFPEIVMTSEYGAGVRTVRMNVPLDNQNHRTYGFTTSVRDFATAEHPQRLCAGKLNGATKDGLVVAGDAALNKITWLSNAFTHSVKANDIVGGAATDSDATGSPNGTGGFTYTVFPNGQINYSLTYVNNTATAITGATVECLLPATLGFISGSAGSTVTTSGTSHYVRWTVDIPANSAGVVTFTTQVLTSTLGTAIAPVASLKKVAVALATTTLPKVTVLEPLRFTLGVVSDSDNSGLTTHKDEAIKYTFTVKNLGSTVVTNVKMGMPWPAGTGYLSELPLSSGTTALKRGVVGKTTGIDWTIASLPAGGTVSVWVLVEVLAAENVVITASNAACKRGTTTITAPAFKTTVLPTLGVALACDKVIARPGDFVNYTFVVHNYGITAIDNAKLVDLLPQGMALASAHTNDGLGNFTETPLNGDNITATTNPGIDRALGIISWTWATLPAKASRSVRFTCQVKFDDPTYYLSNGTSVTNSVSNLAYNFVATRSAIRLFAAKPIGGSSATSVTAAPLFLLSYAVPKTVSLLSGGEPLSPPALALQKSAVADGQVVISGTAITTVVNDTTTSADGVVTYVHSISNAAGAGTATNVQLRDFIPVGTTFLGFVARDGLFVTSYFGFHFYDAAGKETTSTSATRSFTFPVGNLAGGQSTVFSYRVQTALVPGTTSLSTILSNSGGMAGKSGIYTFDPVIGYHLTASNLNFPINGGPRQLKVIVTQPAAFNIGAIVSSRTEAVGSEFTGIAIPLEVLGGLGLNMSGIKIDIPIPKGFLASGAQLFNSLGAIVGTSTISTPNSAGVRTVSFPVGSLRAATALFQVQLDPATAYVLKNAAGQIREPLSITPVATGKYSKPVVAAALAHSAVLADAPPPPAPVVIPPFSALGTLSFLPDPVVKDAKIFVGRCAPATVRRGELLTYTIFVGNLTNVLLGSGVISMNIPTGTTFVSATNYRMNAHDSPSGSDYGFLRSFKAVVSGPKVSWTVGAIANSEGGVVTLTVKVPDTFVGDRIDDNSCKFDVVNATGKTAGPLGVVVLRGNETAQAASATGAAIEGVGTNFTDAIRVSLEDEGFQIGSNSCTVGTGGCDFMHLQNGVVLIPLKNDRIMILGPADKVSASGIRLLHDGMMRIAVGPGTLAGGMGVGVSTIMGLSGVPSVTPNSILIGLNSPTSSLVAQGGGNIVASGGGNLVASDGASIVASGGGNIVASGGGNLIGLDAASLTGTNAARILLPEGNAAILALNVGGKFVIDPTAKMVASGGGNLLVKGGGIVASGGGNLVAQGGGNLIANDGGSLLAGGAGSLVAQGGGNIVASGGGNLVSAGMGNLVNLNGVSSLANVKQ